MRPISEENTLAAVRYVDKCRKNKWDVRYAWNVLAERLGVPTKEAKRALRQAEKKGLIKRTPAHNYTVQQHDQTL